MDNWMIYLLKISCFHGVLVVFYLVFLRKLTFYRFNRSFLLATLVSGLLLPTLQVPDAPVFRANNEIVSMMATRIDATAYVADEVSINGPLIRWDWLLIAVYIIGVFLLFQRYLYNFIKIRKFKHGYRLVKKIGAIEVFRTPFAQPFSFFKSVYIPGEIEGSKEMDLIMAHELQHVNFGHSYDRMLVDFIVVLFWFNPFIYLLRKSLIEVHEYQVDAAVATEPEAKIFYQISLVKMAGGGFAGPVSFFNFSTIKKRMQMMNRTKSNKLSLFSLLILAPIMAMMVSLFSFEMKASNEPETALSGLVPQLSVYVTEPDVLKRVMEIPSIFPVSTKGGKVKVTSTFGKRKDPFDGDMKYHFGMDIAAKEGTPVIATASGEVIEVENQPNGYGRFIVLKHDDAYTTKYAQLSSQEVKVGDRVKKGEMIGKVGNSGRSTAPHLHYEIRKDGKPVDPVPYISDYAFSQVLGEDQDSFQSQSAAIAAQALAKEHQALAEQQRMLAEENRSEAERQRVLAEQQRYLHEKQMEALFESQQQQAEQELELDEVMEQELEVQHALDVDNEIELEKEVGLEHKVELNIEPEIKVDIEPVKTKVDSDRE